jgi:hypothetical protein
VSVCLLSAVCLCVFGKRTSLRVCPPRPSGSGSASPPARGGWGGRVGRVDGAGQGASWQAAAARGVRRVSTGVHVRVRVHVLDQSTGKKVWGRDGRKTLDGRLTLNAGRWTLDACVCRPKEQQMTKPTRPGTLVGDFRRPRRAPLDVDAASSQHASSLFPCKKTTHHPSPSR